MEVQGKRECQVETETEEMKTPEARRNLDPVPNPPPRVEAEGEAEVNSERWWRENAERWKRPSGYGAMVHLLKVWRKKQEQEGRPKE